MANILEVKHLSKYFKTPNGQLHAVEDVSFSIEKGVTLGVVGESGCGKSTLGRAILGLNEVTDGQVIFEGKDITCAKGKSRKDVRKEMQIIFQDPFSSLDSRMSVSQLIAEPLKITGLVKGKEAIDRRVSELMDTVGLAGRYKLSYPHELDGGRRQRIGIARALAVEPKFIVCDEPVSALDVSIQAQILNLMDDLKKERGLTYIFITHNLSVVKHISNEIMVMYCGCMVEKCAARELFRRPLHPYTKGLLSAIPVPSLHVEHKRILLEGEITSPINPAPGCRFCSRCAYAQEMCRSSAPEPLEVEPGHFVACHCISEINGI
ncbi:MAG: putative transporter ATP-binding protein [Oscillospiraceae bacterium]|nr:putative transporter ATP-binding protein [Oscillospiraceae bacterium]